MLHPNRHDPATAHARRRPSSRQPLVLEYLCLRRSDLPRHTDKSRTTAGPPKRYELGHHSEPAEAPDDQQEVGPVLAADPLDETVEVDLMGNKVRQAIGVEAR